MHGGLLHIIFNLLAWWQVGTRLERSFGSFEILYWFWLTVLLAGSLHTAAALALTHFFGTASAFVCSSGLSGVLFALFVFEVYRLNLDSIKLFRVVEVPAEAYPVLLLVIIQLLVPHTSLLGHLSGLCIGYLHVFVLPKPPSSKFATWETKLQLDRIPGYVMSPAPDVLPAWADSLSTGQEGFLTKVWQWLLNLPFFTPRSDQGERMQLQASTSGSHPRAVNVASQSRLVPDV